MGWKSVECGGKLGDGQNGSLLTLREDEKAGRKVLLKSAGERDEGKRLAFCCLLHSGRDPGQACRRLGQPCQRPLAGIASLAAQVNRGIYSNPIPKLRALTRTLSPWEPLSRCIQPYYYVEFTSWILSWSKEYTAYKGLSCQITWRILVALLHPVDELWTRRPGRTFTANDPSPFKSLHHLSRIIANSVRPVTQKCLWQIDPTLGLHELRAQAVQTLLY